MSGGLRSRRSQIALKVEAVEGVAEALTAAEAVLCYEPNYTPSIEEVERRPARSSFTPLQSLTGKRSCALAFGMEIKGSGDVAVAPDWDVPMKACGFQRLALSSVAIGAIAGGPYRPGELVTFVGSGATARVFGRCANGAAKIYVYSVTGVPAPADVVTGGTSGATSTASAGATAAQGFVYLPISTGELSYTIAHYHDGLKKLLVGGRSNFGVAAVNGGLGMFNFAFQGKYGGLTDVAMLSGITYEAEIPPVFLNVGLHVQEFAPIFVNANYEHNNELVLRENAADATGYESVLINGRAPVVSIDPEMTLVADHDWMGTVLAGTAGIYHAEFGSGAGSRVVIASPNAQYRVPAFQDRGGVQAIGIQLRLSGDSVNTEDDEIQIGVY